MVELRSISKYFPSNGVTALDNVDFSVREGEIHALLGENGSGKSTLMHIMAGYFPPSKGTILVDGKKRRFSSPAKAQASGIGMVRQHPGFIKGFKVWEDCALGSEKHGRLFFDPAGSRKRVEEKAAQWHLDLPLDTGAESLTGGQRQKAAILSLLLKDIKWFIFDEPTAALSREETKTLFELYDRLCSRGCGIVFITHKLDEAQAVSGRVTMIKAGVVDAAHRQKGVLRTEGSHRFGVEFGVSHQILEVKGLGLRAPGLPALSNVNLQLMSGTITGINGDRYSGLETLELAITGFLTGHNCKYEGSVALNGQDITGRGVRAFREAGGAYLGSPGLERNLAGELPVFDSLIIHAHRRGKRGAFLDMAYLSSWGEKIMNEAGIARATRDRAVTFSGGMIQRLLLARELAEDSLLLVLSEAGSNLDDKSLAKLEEELKGYARRGKSILLFSSDRENLLSIAGEIKLLYNGTLVENET